MSSSSQPVPSAAGRGEPDLVADVATVIVAQCLEALDADAGFVATVDEKRQRLNVARVTPFSETPVRLELPLDAPYPLAETVRTRQALFIESNERLTCDHPRLVRVAAEDHACATLPLFDTDGGELIGALNLGFDEPHAFSDEELELIDLLGRRCAEAMSLARRVEAEITRRQARGSGAVRGAAR